MGGLCLALLTPALFKGQLYLGNPTRSHWLSSVQSLSCVWFFVTPWTAACQVSLSITSSRSLFKLIMAIALVMSSNNLILCRSLLLLLSIFPSIRVFSNDLVLHIRCQSIGVSASASVFPMNIQDWFPLGWTGWISFAVQGTLKSLLQHLSSKASIIC